MRPEKEERETVCVYEEITNTWTVESSVRRHITRMLKVYDEKYINKEHSIIEDDMYVYIRFDGLTASQVSFRTQAKEKSPEEKQKMAERLKLAREKKQDE